jgi:hypothetical protein
MVQNEITKASVKLAHKAIEVYLEAIDMVTVADSGKDYQYFEYEKGNNSGCYLTIGERLYRLPSTNGMNGCRAYSCSISIYLSILDIIG